MYNNYIIILVLVVLVYFYTLYNREHFMPMDTFEIRYPHLIEQRYSYNDSPTETHDSIIYPYAKLSELPVAYDPTMI